MGSIVVIQKPGVLAVEDYPEPGLEEGQVRIETLYSGISAGTQLTLYRGRNPHVQRRWDPELRLFREPEPGHRMYPAAGCWAYEEVGRAVELGRGVEGASVGDLVYGTWGHRSSHVVTASYAREHKLLPGLDPVVGIYSQIGAVAMNAVLDADIHLGETVAVFGQGVPGQIVTRLAALSGGTVVAVDACDERLERSRAGGAAVTLNPRRGDVAREIKRLTGGRGADVSVEIAGSDAALHEAIRSTTYNGRVICSGFIQGGASELRLGEEFHHNRISVVCSQIQAVSPWLTGRWSFERMVQTVFRLVAEGRLDLASLVTHRIPHTKAQSAYELVGDRPAECMQVVLAFFA